MTNSFVFKILIILDRFYQKLKIKYISAIKSVIELHTKSSKEKVNYEIVYIII